MAVKFGIGSSVLCVLSIWGLCTVVNADSTSTTILTFSSEDLLTEERQSQLFQSWLRIYPKGYHSSESEHAHRLQVFKDNLHFIHKHNKQSGASYSLGLNRFADLSHEEFEARYYNAVFNVTEGHAETHDFAYAGFQPPASIDWRQTGVVARIKDQAQCGSCWAHAVVAAVESVNKIVTGNMVELSEQQLMDCNTANGFFAGCTGGALPTAYSYIVQNGGIDTESDYPYSGRPGWCSPKRKAVSIEGYAKVPSNDEVALMQAVANQPASVGFAASREFQLYAKGIFSGPCASRKNHAATIVGYGTDWNAGGLKYWIMKNSYGADWGEGGFMRIRRSPSVCSMLDDVGYPVKH